MTPSNSLSKFRLPVRYRGLTPTPTKLPRNGIPKAKMPLAECPLLEAVRPVVFTAYVALPAPFNGMGNEDGLTVHEGEDAEAG